MDKYPQTYNDFGVAEAVLEFLSLGDLITESQAKRLIAKSSILVESCEGDTILLETVRYETLTTGDQTSKIAWETYFKVFTNPIDYPDIISVYQGLGFDPTQLPSNKNTLRTNLANLGDKFTEKYGKPNLGMWKDRQKGWAPGGSLRKQFAEEGIGVDSEFGEDNKQPELADVHGGFKNKKTRTASLFSSLNDDNILPGTLYADYTRIPKRNWTSFLRFWNRRKSSVQPDSSLIGREWKKLFLFGYEVQPNMFYEVWYNSVDSSFSVHDSRGSEMSRRAPTMTEAVRKLFNHVLQVSRNDVEYDRSTFNAAIAASIAKAGAQGLASDDRMKDLIRRENKRVEDRAKRAEEQREKQAERMSALKNPKQTAAKVASKAKGAYDSVKDFADAMDTYGMKTTSYDNENYGSDTIDGEYEIDDVTGITSQNTRTRRRNTTKPVETPDSINMGGKNPEGLPNLRRRNKTKEVDTPDVIELEKQAEKKREERAERYEKKLQGYHEERKKALKKNDKVDKKVKPKEDKNSEKVKEKKVKTETKSTKAPKRVGSIFTDKMAEYDDEDFSPYRMKPEDDIEADLIGDDFAEYDDFEETISKITGITESYTSLMENEQVEISDEISDALADEVTEAEYQRRVDSIRQNAEARSYTAGALQGLIASEIVQTYTETKAPKKGKLRWLQQRFLKGRPDIRLLPTDKRPVFNRLKNSLLGGAFRADFILGYTLSDRVDFEIWYVTEPNPEYSWIANIRGGSGHEIPKFISSFYVYDITGERLIRKYIPYYRNALQITSNKLFALV